ncbi:MAG: hypothetical protein KKH61_20035 [Gammaproteobacteria bacterium]|nr:hypothetical protein [Gammaproteobacteria bacterium]
MTEPTQEQVDNQKFEAAALLLLLPLAHSAWLKYAPRTSKKTPSEAALIATLNGLKAEGRALSVQLLKKKITLDEWRYRMDELTNIVYVLSVAAYFGTFELSADDLEIASRKWRSQAAYLQNFYDGAAAGEQKLNGGVINRVLLYVAAGWSILQNIHSITAKLTGNTEERRVLGAADHCPDCIEYAEMDWQPIGTLPDPGVGSVCQSNCHCHKEFR